MIVEFEVVGIPAPKGSARAMVRNGKAIYVPGGSAVGAAKLRSWASEVALQAAQAMAGRPPIVDTPLSVHIEFFFPRPKAHFDKRGVKDSAPYWAVTRPDLDKVIRATWDAMAGIVFDDDSRIVTMSADKRYCDEGDTPGAEISVRAREDL